jgi:hypothetical protein
MKQRWRWSRQNPNHPSPTPLYEIGATSAHLWADRYDREFTDIFAVQDEIAERVAAVIEPQLYAAEHVRSERKPPDSLDARECVVRAPSYATQGTRAEPPRPRRCVDAPLQSHPPTAKLIASLRGC